MRQRRIVRSIHMATAQQGAVMNSMPKRKGSPVGVRQSVVIDVWLTY